MSQKLLEYSPTARRILDEIMIFLFVPEATTSKGIALDQVSTFVTQFSKAAKSEVTIVKCLLNNFIGELEALEKQIELRETEESERSFKARLKAQEKQLQMKEFAQTGQLLSEGREKLRKWLVQDQKTLFRKIKSKELLTLPDFIKMRKVSKRSVITAISAHRKISP